MKQIGLIGQKCNTSMSCVTLVITDGADAHTAFFNERHIGTSITFDRVEISPKIIQIMRLHVSIPDSMI